MLKMARRAIQDSEIISRFRNWLKESRFSSKTISNYISIVRHFEKIIIYFGSLDERSINFFLESTDKEYSKADVPFGMRKQRICRYILRTFFDSIDREELRLKVKKPRRTMKPREVKRDVLPEKKIRELFRLAGGYVRREQGIFRLRYRRPEMERQLIVRLLYEGAVRVGELCPTEIRKKRRVSHIDFDSNAIEVIGKGGNINLVYFKPKTANLLRRYIEENQLSQDSLLFSNENPWTVWRWLSLFSSDILRQRITPHVLRRSCLTHMIQHGAGLKTVQDYARHVEPKTTTLYIQLAGGLRKEAGERFVPEL
jgi:integrase